VKSDWVRGEAQTAHELGKLVPIKIAKCQLPINYRGIHTPEVYTSRAEHIKLAKILSDKYGTKIEFPVDSSANFLSKLTTQKVAYQKEYSELSNDWSREEWGKTFRLMKKYPLGATWVIGATALFIFIGVALAWWTGPFGPPRHKDDFTTLRSGPGLESLLSSQKSPGKPLRNYDKQWQENWKTLHQSRKSRPGPD
jgi:hypothetical protein